MKIALQYRDQARRVYYASVFEAKQEILVTIVRLRGIPRRTR